MKQPIAKYLNKIAEMDVPAALGLTEKTVTVASYLGENIAHFSPRTQEQLKSIAMEHADDVLEEDAMLRRIVVEAITERQTIEQVVHNDDIPGLDLSEEAINVDQVIAQAKQFVRTDVAFLGNATGKTVRYS